MPETALSPLQLCVLELEGRTWSQPGAKHSAFRDRYPHVTETGYYRCLHLLLDNPAAERHDPVLIHRLRRLRDSASPHRVG